jgi:Spy/CpxP family protein refolding chaperone
MKRLAVIVFLAAMPLALFAQSQGQGPRGQAALAPDARLLQDLGLTDAQSAQVMEIQSRTRLAMRQSFAQVRLLRAQIDRAMLATPVDMQAVNGFVDQLAQARGTAQKTFLAARVQLGQIMGPDKFQVYREHLRQRFARGFRGGGFDGQGPGPGFMQGRMPGAMHGPHGWDDWM